jgi:hypothetical protein
MAACPVAITPLARRRPLVLTRRRLEANRRNARHSTGPRTAQGKATVARNPIKHGFFAAPQRWTPAQHRDFEALLDGFRDDFHPGDALEEGCVRILAESYVRMAAALRYESIAALKHHRAVERELEGRIAAAEPGQAARLKARREHLREAGLWGPTIAGEREAMAIMRYLGRLDRTIAGALAQLNRQKQTHFAAAPRSGPEALRRAGVQRFEASGPATKAQKQTHFEESPVSGSEARQAAEGPPTGSPSEIENVKTNPLSSMIMGNRHQRRRAKALARRR